VADPTVLRSLLARLHALRPESRRRWGTLTAQEMLCHLGDATGMVLRTRPRVEPVASRARSVVKLVALWSPFRWPHGWPTNPMHDPKADGTQPAVFVEDFARAVAGLEGIAAAKPDTLEPVHGFFGTMSVADWQRWAYKHTDHHLRQFGV
jgi:hypothetical protein